MTQTQYIKDYIEEYGSITPLEALREFGCMRLAARINDIERQGTLYEHKTEHYVNKFGQNRHYTRYCKVVS